MTKKLWAAGLRGGLALGLVLTAGLQAHAEDTSSKVEKCERKLGVLAVAEPQSGWGYLQHYGLGSPAALLRMMVQQSGCFDVVERGVAMQNLQQERTLAAGGDLRQESNVGKGQMQAADFVMTPNVQIGSSTTGGLGGLLAGKLGPLGGLVGNMKFKEASTSILVADVRSSIQVASAEGKATKTDFGVGGWGFGGGALGALGGYTSTPEGKMVAASLLDNYNNIVTQIRNQPQLIRASSASGDANAAASTSAEAPQTPGAMLAAKIANVKAFEGPSRDSKVIATLQKSDELIATGEVKNGFLRVDSANFSGWVQRTLVGPMSAQVTNPTPLPLTRGQQQLGMGIFGTFSGSFSGAERGSFIVVVGSDGQVSGSGNSNQTGAFNVSGHVDPSGNLSLTASGNAGSALYNGRIDGASGTISGNWRYSQANGGGNFSGRRQ
jgi:curli biogenesis system outer membrane secretion channel CsgG